MFVFVKDWSQNSNFFMHVDVSLNLLNNFEVCRSVEMLLALGRAKLRDYRVDVDDFSEMTMEVSVLVSFSAS